MKTYQGIKGSQQNIRSLTRLYNTYKTKGLDINRTNLKRHDNDNTKDLLQVIVSCDYLADRIKKGI